MKTFFFLSSDSETPLPEAPRFHFSVPTTRKGLQVAPFHPILLLSGTSIFLPNFLSSEFPPHKPQGWNFSLRKRITGSIFNIQTG